jgi:ketosteroid isomerase-like protein
MNTTEDINLFFVDLYQNFNNRNIESVIANMTADVKWANGMEGGYVFGHDEVRAYWTRQFTMVSAKVTPMKIEEKNGLVNIKIHQVVHDLDKNLLADEIVEHIFLLKGNKVKEFHIGNKQ